jgi:DNA-binding transcriptional MerR regulator
MVNQKHFSIKQMAQAASISVRTLHYYDQIGLLKSHRKPHNNYRYYPVESLLRLQQIRFYKELGFELSRIKDILDQPGFDYQQALTTHREALMNKVEQTKKLVQTIDRTLAQLKGEVNMAENEYFIGFSDEQQAAYEKEAAERWDPVVVKESNRRWKSLSKQEQQDLMKNGERITLALRDLMSEDPGTEKVQSLVDEWKKHIDFFYDCTPEILLGLAQNYMNDPRFHEFYSRIDPGLPQFFYDATKIYCSRRGVTE